MWAKVRDVEEELEQKTSHMKEVEKKLNDCKQNIQKRDDKIVSLKETIRLNLFVCLTLYNFYYYYRTLEEQILEIKDQIEIQKRPQIDIKNQIDELDKHYSEKSKEIHQIQITIKAKTSDMKSLEEDIATSNEK